MRRLILALFMLLSINAVAAGQDDELQRLHSALNMLDQEQLAIYQQFQMVQELRRSLPIYGTFVPPQLMGPPPSYDEAVAAQKRAFLRDEALSEQASQLLDKYNEIEERKKPLQQKIYGLTQGN